MKAGKIQSFFSGDQATGTTLIQPKKSFDKRRGLLPTLGLASALLLTPVLANAQQISSAIRGKVTDANGQLLANATVRVIDERTGVERTYTTNDSGTFFASRLPVGGPYKVMVQGRTITVDSISLGDIKNLPINLAAIEEVVVTASAGNAFEVATGPSANFGTYELETAVAINRDINEVYSLDPRINLDNSDGGNAINCAGKHPRFNSITLDGVSQNDRFGLNNNGYSTAVGMPFPFDAISQVSVSLAPFDVTYGGFSACNVNAVTKSGANELEGNVFYEFSNQDMRGDKLGGVDGDFATPSFEEINWGFSVGGALIEDKLFAFFAYEESERPRFLSQGFAGSGNGEERPWLSQADYQRIVDIANNVYNYDPGGLPGDGTQEDEKYILRLDYQINENHSASLIYNYYDGFQIRASDSDSNEFEFPNHYYTKGSESETTTFVLNSQWTDAFSTQFFYSQNEMNDSQVTVGDKEFGDHQIAIDGRTGTVYLGADDSRQANALNTESEYLKLSGQFLWEDHVFTFGYEREALEVFNQFVQHARGGEYDYFDSSGGNPEFCDALTAAERNENPDCGLSGIDKFELGLPNRIYYGSAGGTNDATDAAANFENVNHALYLQDEFFIDEFNLTIVAGIRYEWFTSDDAPNFNPAFTDANGGLRNDGNIDGLDIWMPRLGFTWEASDELTVRGGLGLFSGGNPNVWISNAWSNDGLTNVQLRESFDGSILTDVPLVGAGRPGYDVPQVMFDEVAATSAANASTRRVVLLDPNYEQPSEWKFALGATWQAPMDIQVEVDWLHTEVRDPAIYLDISQEIVGETILGQPIYDYTNGQDNYMLTNSGRKPKSDVFSVVLRKDFDFGLDLMVGYSYMDAEDVSPMTSSTAGSNWDNVATLNPNDVSVGTSNYVTPHRFTFRASYGTEFFDGLETRISLMAYASEGQPQSWVMGSGDLEGDGFFGRHLLYIPTGVDDPNVVFEDGFQTDEFFQWVAAQGLDSGFVDRNQKHAGWTNRFDIRIDQDLPTFVDGTYGKVYLKVYNFGNLINDEWGHVSDAQFFSIQQVDSSVDSAGRYVFEDFNDRDFEDLQTNRSLWQARVGVEFSF